MEGPRREQGVVEQGVADPQVVRQIEIDDRLAGEHFEHQRQPRHRQGLGIDVGPEEMGLRNPRSVFAGQPPRPGGLLIPAHEVLERGHEEDPAAARGVDDAQPAPCARGGGLEQGGQGAAHDVLHDVVRRVKDPAGAPARGDARGLLIQPAQRDAGRGPPVGAHA